MKLLTFLIFSLCAMSFNAQAQYERAYDVCVRAAFEYQDRGGSVDPYAWCSDVRTMPEARCRSIALPYKLSTDPGMNVASWCRDVQTRAEVICRRGGLRYKRLYDNTINVSSWCRDVGSVPEAKCRERMLEEKGRYNLNINVKETCRNSNF